MLIHAAAGGVGSAALQLARAAGAHVIALAGSAEKARFCAAARRRRRRRHQRHRLRDRGARGDGRPRRRRRVRHHRRRHHHPHLRLHGLRRSSRARRVRVRHRGRGPGRSDPAPDPVRQLLAGRRLPRRTSTIPSRSSRRSGSNFLSRGRGRASARRDPRSRRPERRCGRSSDSTCRSPIFRRRSTRWNAARPSAGSSCAFPRVNERPRPRSARATPPATGSRCRRREPAPATRRRSRPHARCARTGRSRSAGTSSPT